MFKWIVLNNFYFYLGFIYDVDPDWIIKMKVVILFSRMKNENTWGNITLYFNY
jgi:hypothetical protein